MSDHEKEFKFEITKSAKPKQVDRDFTILNRSIKADLESRAKDQQSISESSFDSAYTDQLIENLLRKLFASSLSGEVFVDQDINNFLNDFIYQIRVERDLQYD